MFNSKKILSVAVDISQLLCNNQCTYDETEEILQLLQSEIKHQRENYEYDTAKDFFNGDKTNCANDIIIKSLRHIDGFC